MRLNRAAHHLAAAISLLALAGCPEEPSGEPDAGDTGSPSGDHDGGAHTPADDAGDPSELDDAGDPVVPDDGGGEPPGDGSPALGAISPLTVEENQVRTLTLPASDPDGDELSFTLLSAPAWATLSGDVLTLAPGFDDAGEHVVGVQVSDGAHSATGSVEVTVTNTNRAPEIVEIASVTVAIDTAVDVPISVSDPDGDAVILSLVGAPSFATLVDEVLTLAPGMNALGSHTLTVEATDGSASVSRSVDVTVARAQRAPLIASLRQLDEADALVSAGAHVDAAPLPSVSFLDPDGDTVSIEIELIAVDDSFAGVATHVSAFSSTSPQTIAPGALGVGDFKWQARAIDVAGAASPWFPFNNGATAFTLGDGAFLGSLSIAGGKDAIRVSTVELTLNASSAAGTLSEMRFSNDGVIWTAFEPYATSKQGYVLAEPDVDGVKKVWVELKDSAGGTARMSDTVVVDRVAPDAPILDHHNGLHVTNGNPVDFTVTTTEPSTLGLRITYLVHDDYASNVYPMWGSEVPFTPALSVSGTWGPRDYITAWLKDAAGNYSGGTRYLMDIDVEAPAVSSAGPSNGEVGVWPEAPIRVAFSEHIDPTSFNATNVTVSGATGRWELDGTSRGATFLLDAPMVPGSVVSLTFDGLKDPAGNSMEEPYSYSFTVGSSPTRFSSPALPKGMVPLKASNASGTLLLFVDTADTASSARVPGEWRWAFWNGGAWSGGSLGPGALDHRDGPAPARLVAWGDKFVASWPTMVGRRWAIFDQGLWTWPSAPAPRGDIAANELGVMQAYQSSVRYYADPFGQYITDQIILVELFNGTAWSAPTLLHQRGYYSFEPRIVASADNFAVMTGIYSSGTYYTTLRVYTSPSGEWQDGKTVTSGSDPGQLVSNSGGFAFAPRSGGYPVVFDGTQWHEGTLPNISLLATDGQGFAAVSRTGAVEVFEDGAWTPPVTLGGSPAQLEGNAGRYLLLSRDEVSAALEAQLYDGTWSAPYQAANVVDPATVQVGGATLTSDLAVATFEADGDAHSLVHTASGWTTVSTLQSEPATSGALNAIDTGTSIAVVLGDGRDHVARAWNGAGFDAAQFLSTSTIDTMSAQPQIAFLPSGEGLAVWQQYDLGVAKIFWAAYDGVAWQPAERLADLPGTAPRIAQNGLRFVVLFQSRVDGEGNTRHYGAYAVPVTPGVGAGAPVELMAPELNVGYARVPAIGSDGSGFLATYGSRASTSDPFDVLYRTSADGLSWSAPAVLEADVSDVGVVGQVLGNSIGYLIATEIATNQWSRRLYSAGTLSPATTVTTFDARIGAGLTSFAWVHEDNDLVVSLYSGSAWSSPESFDGYTAHALVGNGGSYLFVFDQNWSEWNGTAWSVSDSLGSPALVDAVADGAGYAAAAVTGSAEGQVLPMTLSGGSWTAHPNLGGPTGRWHPVVGVGLGTRFLVWEQTDPAQGVTRMHFTGF